jgi:hypothetical protein
MKLLTDVSKNNAKVFSGKTGKGAGGINRSARIPPLPGRNRVINILRVSVLEVESAITIVVKFRGRRCRTQYRRLDSGGSIQNNHCKSRNQDKKNQN